NGVMTFDARMAWGLRLAGIVFGVVTLGACAAPPSGPDEGGDTTAQADASYVAAHDSARFSPLTEITPENVGTLVPAWTYHSGDFAGGQGPSPRGQVPGL